MTKQILLTKRTPTYWRVTINHPPLNIFGPDTIPQLNEVVSAMEQGFHKPGDMENRLGYYVGQLARSLT